MNIGFFSDTYHPDINGVVPSIRILEKKFKEQGHNLYIITSSKHEKTEDVKDIIMLSSLPLVFQPSYRLSTFYSVKDMKRIKELDLDIIHTHSEFSLGIFGLIAARELRIPVIHTFHTKWEDYLHYVTPRFISNREYAKKVTRQALRMFFKRCDCVIAPTAAMEQYIRDKCNIRTKPISVIPSAINLQPFHRENYTAEELNELKDEFNIREKKVLLTIGRIAKEKNIDITIKYLPRIFKENPDAVMLIIGDGPELSNLKKLASDLSISDKVIFAGKKPWEMIGKYYNIGDVFINSSTSETQGLTYIEAMAAGVPIVVKKADNLTGMVTDGENGYIFNQNSEIVDKVNYVLKNEPSVKKIIINGLTTSEQYSPDVFASRILSLYNQAIDRFV